MAVVVSDTSPVRALAQLSLLHVCEPLFGVVLLPPAVADELRVRVSGLPALEPNDLPCFRVQAPTDRAQVAELTARLDLGEAEAIALAIEVRAVAILIDEAAGRRAAKGLGLRPLGVLGLLVRAKHAGHIQRVEPLVDRLQQELGFWVSPAVRRAVRDLSGE